MSIRIASHSDASPIHDIHFQAFHESERTVVARLAVALLHESTIPETLSWVMVSDQEVIGHVAFSPVWAEDSALCGYILSPLGVKPSHQAQGIGSRLVHHAKKWFSDAGINTLFVYGDPAYYERFGFDADLARQYIPPFKLSFPDGWLAVVLNDHSSTQAPVRLRCVDALNDPSLW